MHSTATRFVSQNNERAKGLDENICDLTSENAEELGGSESQQEEGHVAESPQCLEEEGEQPVKESDDNDQRAVRVFASSERGFLYLYSTAALFSDRISSAIRRKAKSVRRGQLRPDIR